MSRTARLGAFILGTLAVLVLGIFIIGSKKYLFTPTYTLRAKFANVAGLQSGADVLIGGVHSGTIRSIDLPTNPADKVTVTMELNKATHTIVKQDSIASIQTEGLLGNQFVSLSFGSPGQADVKDGQIINSVPPLEMAAILDKANSLLATGQTAMNNIASVTENLKSVSAKVDHGQGTAGALVNDRALYNNLEATSAEAKSTVAAAQTGITDFQDNMEALKHNFLLRGYFKNRGYEDSSDLGRDEIVSLPSVATSKDFTFSAKHLFDKPDSAKLKNEKSLKEAGEALANEDFGAAVIQVSAGTIGNSDDLVKLTQARSMVIRDYLVQHYGFDDTKLKTISVGKQGGTNSKDDWGEIKILIYPPGTAMPALKSPSKSPAPTPTDAPPKTEQK
ncbi:MlaD family protein [Acidicapsa ligni]|uniref:MlaD family protein n=1 Tax=Acidicapsa ligni TaxID=542300 RepID=UPI0021DFAC1A|nr:MlaD family protein [Acidicapsa ligni]